MKNSFNPRHCAAIIERSAGRLGIRLNAAFTVVELAVSIVIVILLVSLSILATSRVKSSMQSARCVSNLRQLQSANIVYAGLHDNSFVPVFINGAETASEGRVLWTGNKDFITLLSIFRPVTSISDLQKAWPRQLLCPRATIDGGRIDRCYAYNRTGISALYSKPGARAAVRATEIANPARVIAFIDALNWMMDYDVALGDYTEEVTQNNTIAFRHDGRAYAVFFDGHVEPLTKAQVTGDPALWRIKDTLIK